MIKTALSNTITLMPGAYIAPDVILEEHIYIGANAVVLAHNEKTHEPTNEPTIIRTGVEIGANATIYPGLIIGTKARITHGSVVTRSVPPFAIVAGNPAYIQGYVETTGQHAGLPRQLSPAQPGVRTSSVKGVTLHTFKSVLDLRGNLSAGEFNREIPFIPKRYFLVFNVPSAETRGEHAHLQCEQFLIAIKGNVSVVADDGYAREEFLLNELNMGLYLPPMTWGIQYRYSTESVLLVFASEYYNANDYIRDYTEFQKLALKPGVNICN